MFTICQNDVNLEFTHSVNSVVSKVKIVISLDLDAICHFIHPTAAGIVQHVCGKLFVLLIAHISNCMRQVYWIFLLICAALLPCICVAEKCV